MFSKIFELPFSADAYGFLKQMTELVTEYKKLVVNNHAIFYDLRLKSLQHRFIGLKACRKNFRFNETEQSEYADLVIQFNDANPINNVGDLAYNDTKQSLLGEFR